MQLRHFVLMCSVVLMAWLAMAFVHEVPASRYVETAEHEEPAPTALVPVSVPEAGDLAVSVSP